MPSSPIASRPIGHAPAATDWVSAAADAATAEAAARPPATVVCASGISPSGPIHLGNLREILTQHFVAEELRARGVAADHVLFFDDYDRLRRIPAGMPGDLTEHLGRPLCEVPDPYGEHASWADRFAGQLRTALVELGVPVREVRQSERYRDGTYTDQVCRAMAARAQIDAVLADYRTEPSQETDYYPYRVYCRRCRRDDTRVTRYDQTSTGLSYQCRACGADRFRLADECPGKLSWKIDWAMRWSQEPVTFEAAGVDHAAAGSSITVASRLCRQVFDARPPALLAYGWVGTRGTAKLSSSAGEAPTPGDALRVLEPALLRWLYARRRPLQPITVDFGTEVTRIYHEWDRLAGRVAAGNAGPIEALAYQRARRVPTGPARPVGWRLLSAVLDVTANDDDQLLRIVARAGYPDITLADLQPRRALAAAWLAHHVPPQERTRIRQTPDRATLANVTAEQRQAIDLLLAELPDRRDLPDLTGLVYGIPKRLRGLAEDAPATAEVKQAQRELFGLLYRLLVGADTGPRLPTLLLALGPDRVTRLLGR